MNRIISGLVISMALSGTANALTTFSNGEKTDANAVNGNFTELDGKITSANTNISNLQTQLNTLIGSVPQTYDNGNYGVDVNTYKQKVFNVTDSVNPASYVIEYQTFGKVNSKTLMYRNRYDGGGNLVALDVFTYSKDASGNKTWDEVQGLNTTAVTSASVYNAQTSTSFAAALPDSTYVDVTRVMNPPIERMPKVMVEGQTWGSGSTLTVTSSTLTVQSPVGATQVNALLGVEDVTLQNVSIAGAAAGAVTLTGCLKISTQRIASGLGNNVQTIGWYCPNGIGLAKQIIAKPYVINPSTPSLAVETRIMELTSIK